MVETHQESMTLPIRMVSLIAAVNNMLLKTFKVILAIPLISVKTAHGHLLQLMRPDKINVGLLTTRSTTSPTIMVSQEQTR